MATVGTLNIFVNAVTKKFDDGISSVQKKIRSLTKGFADIHGALSVAERAFNLASVAASALADEIERLDTIGDTAARLDISVDSLQKFHRVAEIASSDIESMNKALSIFQRTLGDAASGDKAALKAFERIGLDAKLLSEAGLDTAFTAVLAKLGQIPNAAERASLATDLFGRSSLNLTDVIANGATAMEQATNDLNMFGTALNDRIKDVDKAKNAMEQLSLATSGFRAELATLLAPATANAVSGWTTAIASARNVQVSDLLGAFDPFNPVSGTLAGTLGRGYVRSVTNRPFGSGTLANPDTFTNRPGMDSAMLDAYMIRGMLTARGATNVPGRGPSVSDAFRDVFSTQGFIQRREARTISERGGAGALEFGSVGAYQAVQASQRQDEALKLQKMELEEAKKTNDKLDRVIENAIILSELDLQG